ncbi:uncharacterized protein LOC126595265 [Malus sylvestris]|uniref:uncharacterized protein LOC126595265 n=1 Tax=Malus sylvestris TaxID=3752 RepID=UPI0021ACCCA1|nr:uncharacterized protein LOC126595265 [Malus sylvestris]
MDVAFHENDMYFANPESSLQGQNQKEVQTLDYTIPDIDRVNDLDLSGDVLEISGDHSHENNDVNELELSGNVLETSGDHSHGNNVENLERDESTSPDNSLPNSSLPVSSPPDILVSPATLYVHEALTDPRWQVAMNEELKSLKKNATWEITDFPVGKKPVGCKWVYTVKYKADETVDHFKARLNEKLTALIVYVDDMVVTSNDLEERAAL